jgi:energy-converting hydrogenase Eha subunit A
MLPIIAILLILVATALAYPAVARKRPEEITLRYRLMILGPYLSLAVTLLVIFLFLRPGGGRAAVLGMVAGAALMAAILGTAWFVPRALRRK